jgi:hypothetical protein
LSDGLIYRQMYFDEALPLTGCDQVHASLLMKCEDRFDATSPDAVARVRGLILR